MKHSLLPLTILLLLELLATSHTFCPPGDPAETIRHLTRHNRMPSDLIRKRLLTCFLKDEAIPLAEMRAALNKLFEVGPPAALVQNEQLLFQAIERFHNTPGFQSVMRAILLDRSRTDQRPRRSFIWQLQCALHYAQEPTQPETIVAFERQCPSPNQGGTSLFGIVSKEESGQEIWSVCKDVAWSRYKPHKSAISKELRLQNTIVQTTEVETPESPRYRVCSKRPLPDNWQEWLSEHEIHVESPKAPAS